MAYQYKYIPSSLIARAQKGTNPKDQYVELFQETLNEQFYNSSNWWTIQEETAIGSEEYEEIDVRISHVINSETGLKLGDDWKTVYFKDVAHITELGKYYIFDDNTWLVINIESIKGIASTCTIRRCNNALRWIDEPTGATYEEPCIIEYQVKEPRDYFTQGSPFMTPGGFLHINTQLNSRTGKIKENQRFLFGNQNHWTAYKTIGTGINDFKNIETFDNDSAQILTLDVISNYVNKETDDIVNGIADVYTNVYSVVFTSGSISGSPTGEIQIDASIIYNNDTVIREMEWESSDVSIASVSASGLVTFNSVGTCIITGNVKDNIASDTCWISVSASTSLHSEILFSPNTNYVLEGDSRQYSVYRYENNIQQADAFVVVCNGSNVPSTSYQFVQDDGNHFTVSNILRDIESYLIIECTTGSFATEELNVYLRGAWQFDNI
jgi:hypothetical protein